jgi:hypothetical protein
MTWRSVRIGLAALPLAACMPAPKVESHAEWLAEATRAYPGERPERVISAAEAVLRHADPGDLAFDYRVGGFTAERKFLVYAVLAAAEGEDRWTFNASGAGDGAKANVALVERARVHGAGGARQVRSNRQQIGTFRLFYARIDYLLGRRPDWVACREAPAKLALPPEAPGTEGLCGLTLQGRDAPPPAPLRREGPAKVAAAGSPPAGTAPELDDGSEE